MLTCISKVLIFTGFDHKLEYLPYITISDITLFIDLFRYVATSQFNKLTYLLTLSAVYYNEYSCLHAKNHFWLINYTLNRC